MAGTIEILSVGPEDIVGNDTSDNPVISADGRVVAFASIATNLVPDDDNDFSDIFVRDREGGVTELVSVGVGDALADDESYQPSISADGRFVAFESFASNLVEGDTNETDDVFVRDRQTGTTVRVSVDADGNEGDGYSSSAAISADGSFVAFASGSSNLVAGDTNGVQDIFVHDLASGTTERVSVSTVGEEGNANSSSLGSPPAISADGRFVAFESYASNLVAGDTNGSDDVFVHDRENGTTVRVSVDADGNEGFGASFNPAISADGRFVAFASISSLVPNDDNFSQDIFVKELATGIIERVSVSATGEEGDGGSFAPAISADGRFVAFASGATNLVPDDTNELTDLFVVDREAGTIARISVGTEGQQANDSSFGPALTADGALAAFFSNASNFGFEVGNGNGTSDVFLATTAAVPPPVVQLLPPLTEKVPLLDSEIFGAPLFLVGPSGDAGISFVDEVAAFQSSLGVYLVGSDGTIGATGWVFDRIEHSEASDLASASARPGGGPLSPGDSVLLSDLFAPEELTPGAGFGLFLAADGWALNDAAIFAEGSLAFRSNGGPASVTDTTPELVHIAGNGTETLVLGHILHSIDTDSADPLSNTLNPGGTGQVTSGLLDGAFTVAFEDKPLGANSDRDFNDALFAVDAANTEPPSAAPVSVELQMLLPEAADATAA